jgi:hypothetical protein
LEQFEQMAVVSGAAPITGNHRGVDSGVVAPSYNLQTEHSCFTVNHVPQNLKRIKQLRKQDADFEARAGERPEVIPQTEGQQRAEKQKERLRQKLAKKDRARELQEFQPDDVEDLKPEDVDYLVQVQVLAETQERLQENQREGRSPWDGVSDEGKLALRDYNQRKGVFAAEKPEVIENQGATFQEGAMSVFMMQALPRKTITKDKSRSKASGSRDKDEDDDATVEMPVKDDDADMESDSDAEQAPTGKQKPKEKLEAMPKMAIMQKDFDQRKAAIKGETGFTDAPVMMAMVEECEGIMEKLKQNKQVPFKDLLKDQLTIGQLGALQQDRVSTYNQCPVQKARLLSKNYIFAAERTRLESIAKAANDTVQLLDLTVKVAFASCYTVPTTGKMEHGSLGQDVQSIRDEKVTAAVTKTKPEEQATWSSWAATSFLGKFFNKKK